MIDKHSVVWDNAYAWLEAFNKSFGSLGDRWEPFYTPVHPSPDLTDSPTEMVGGEYCEMVIVFGCETGDTETTTCSFDVSGEDNAKAICDLYNHAPDHIDELLKYADELAAQLHVAQVKLNQANVTCPICSSTYSKLDYVHCPACYSRAMAANRET